MPFSSRPIQLLPGVEPVSDKTAQSSQHAVFSDKIRFVDGYPEKIGGWRVYMTEGQSYVNGCPRMIFSYVLDNQLNYIIGTDTNLYYLTGADLTNITPVQTSSISINNKFSTIYGTLSNNPLATIIGSNVITVTDSLAYRLRDDDFVRLSGAVTINGIPDTEINASHLVQNVTATTFDITVNTSATSTGTGGGASVVRAMAMIEVTQVLPSYSEGDNVVVDGAGAAVGGIPDSEINGIQRVRNITPTAYDFPVTTYATSSVSATGGTADVYLEIPNGLCNATINQGYGLNLYGVGLYGVPKTALNASPPTIWAADRFGSLVILTPGDQTGLYSWDSDINVLPELVANAPAAINYCFSSNEIVVTLGASGVGNRIKWSDQGNITVWSATAQNQAGEDDIESAGDFISHCSLRGFNLLFTRNKVFTFRYIGKPFIWETKELDPARGLISQNARVVVNGIAYWMGADNFYLYRGGNVEIIPANSQSQTTLKNYIFDDLNIAQKDKIFCWYNQKFNEIWWHYPSNSSNECDRIARFNVLDLTWCPDTMQRSAGEYPTIIGDFPFMVDIDGDLYQHEAGHNDNEEPLPFLLRTKFFNAGMDTINLQGIIPDSIQTGDISLTLITKRYPNTPTPSASGPYTITPETIKLSYRKATRYWQYEIAGSEIDQHWSGGEWMEIFNQSSRL